jgi:hypothetical protein
LENTDFLREYRKISQQHLNEKMILDSLPNEMKSIFNKFPKKLSLSEKCVRLWSLDCICDKINKAIIYDNEKLLNKYMPIIRGVNLYLNTKSNKSLTGISNIKMDVAQFESIMLGKVYRMPHYISCNVSKHNKYEKNSDELDNKNTIIIFQLDENCWNGKEISEHSVYPEQKEIVLPPYTALQVIKKIAKLKGYQEVHVKVLDNLEVEQEEKNGKLSFLCTWLMPKIDDEEGEALTNEQDDCIGINQHRKKLLQEMGCLKYEEEGKSNDEDKEKIDIEQLKINSFHPICNCGNILVLMNWNLCYNGSDVCCNICKQVIKQQVYHCDKCDENNSYDECIPCAKIQVKNYE